MLNAGDRSHTRITIVASWIEKKLARLKYLQLQTNKYLSQFLKWLVSMFSVIDSLICEYTDPMNIVCQSSFKLLVLTKR